MTMSAIVPLGAKVTAEYRKNDQTGKVWFGVVIAADDPRAWHNTLAFPCRNPNCQRQSDPWCTQLPDQEQVKEHVKHINQDGQSVPVLWDFGYPRVWWESAEKLMVVA